MGIDRIAVMVEAVQFQMYSFLFGWKVMEILKKWSWRVLEKSWNFISKCLWVPIFIYPVVCYRQSLDNPYMCYVFRTPLLPPPPWPIHS